MYRRLCALFVVLMSVLLLFVSNVVSAASTIEPTQFVQPEDFAGRLHGFVIGRVAEHPDSYYSDIRDYGANLVRVFFPFKRCVTCDGYDRSTADVDLFEKMLDAAARNHLKVVVVGGFQQLESGEIWKRADLQDSVVKNWQTFAKQYVGNTTIAGFDLMNEPIPVAGNGWQQIAQRIVDAIRTVDQNHVVIMESAPGALPSGFQSLMPIRDRRVVYSVHFYSPHDITHQLVMTQMNREIPYPAGIEYGIGKWDPINGVGPWDKRRLSLMLDPVRKFAKKYNAIIYVGEFSCVRWAPDGSSTRWVSDAQELISAEKWSWTYHEFRGWSGWDAEIANNDFPANINAPYVRSPDAPTISILKRAMFTFQ